MHWNRPCLEWVVCLRIQHSMGFEFYSGTDINAIGCKSHHMKYNPTCWYILQDHNKLFTT